MAIKTSIHEAKRRLSELLERAHSGEEVVITKAGKPYARLIPIVESGARREGMFPEIAGDIFGPIGPDDSAWG